MFNMKYNYKKHLFGVITIVVVIYVLTLLFPHKFALQYLDENKELQTEVFNSTKEYNKRAEELRQDSVTFWRN